MSLLARRAARRSAGKSQFLLVAAIIARVDPDVPRKGIRGQQQAVTFHDRPRVADPRWRRQTPLVRFTPITCQATMRISAARAKMSNIAKRTRTRPGLITGPSIWSAWPVCDSGSCRRVPTHRRNVSIGPACASLSPSEMARVDIYGVLFAGAAASAQQRRSCLPVQMMEPRLTMMGEPVGFNCCASACAAMAAGDSALTSFCIKTTFSASSSTCLFFERLHVSLLRLVMMFIWARYRLPKHAQKLPESPRSGAAAVYDERSSSGATLSTMLACSGRCDGSIQHIDLSAILGLQYVPRTRSLALRERGLRRTSASLGWTAFLVTARREARCPQVQAASPIILTST